MASEKKPKRGRPPGRKESMVVQARVSPELHAALEKLAQQNRRTKNAELILALEKHLEEAGLWSGLDDAKE
jgi:predicted HicB family RNase H-like nuclease